MGHGAWGLKPEVRSRRSEVRKDRRQMTDDSLQNVDFGLTKGARHRAQGSRKVVKIVETVETVEVVKIVNSAHSSQEQIIRITNN